MVLYVPLEKPLKLTRPLATVPALPQWNVRKRRARAIEASTEFGPNIATFILNIWHVGELFVGNILKF